jgi:glycosyltransferase involved in cell wall biosynthesis
MMKVAALTGGRTDPASRFRVRQHVEPLREFGIEIHEYPSIIDRGTVLPDWTQRTRARRWATFAPILAARTWLRLPEVVATWSSDLTWLCRALVEPFGTIEPLLKRPYVFDVDDATWMLHVRGWRVGKYAVPRIAGGAVTVIAGNKYLAEFFSYYARSVHIVPTAVDTHRFVPDSGRDQDTNFVIGWTGTKSTLPYLYQIEPPLRAFLESHPHASLRIISDRAPQFDRIPPNRVTYIPWTPEVEASAIQPMDVGLMPLPDDEFTRGKCSFKMLQYMACAVPVIVSPVGMNADILSEAKVGIAATDHCDWRDALEYVHRNRALGRRWGTDGRALVMCSYSRDVIARRLACIFTSMGH